MIRYIIKGIVSCMLVFFLSTANGVAASYVYDAGELVGADDVLVQETMYDVRFVTGSAVGVFGGITSTGSWDGTFNYDFMSVEGARVATSQLIMQVFGTDEYATEVTMYDLRQVRGIEDRAFGYIVTPYGTVPQGSLRGPSVEFRRWPPWEGGGETWRNRLWLTDIYVPTNIHDDLAAVMGRVWENDASYVWAKWTLAPAAVPEPATILLFGSGCAGLAVMRRRKKGKQN